MLKLLIFNVLIIQTFIKSFNLKSSTNAPESLINISLLILISSYKQIKIPKLPLAVVKYRSIFSVVVNYQWLPAAVNFRRLICT